MSYCLSYSESRFKLYTCLNIGMPLCIELNGNEDLREEEILGGRREKRGRCHKGRHDSRSRRDLVEKRLIKRARGVGVGSGEWECLWINDHMYV